MTEEKIIEIGTVKHFFSKINVAIIALTGKLSVGDNILVKGPTTDVEMKVDSLQIEHKNIQSAEGGEVGLKMTGNVKERDVVYKKHN
jgi:hypothetical protein